MKVAALLTAALLAAGTAQAQSHPDHVVVAPQDIKWGPAPAFLPPGAQAAVVYGDPTKAGPFVIRLKAPKGYHVPPHTHPTAELVTVLSGKFDVGMGPTADRAKTQTLPKDGFVALPAGMQHYAYAAEDDTVVQINSTGPFAITYVNPKDDPRNKAK